MNYIKCDYLKSRKIGDEVGKGDLLFFNLPINGLILFTHLEWM